MVALLPAPQAQHGRQGSNIRSQQQQQLGDGVVAATTVVALQLLWCIRLAAVYLVWTAQGV